MTFSNALGGKLIIGIKDRTGEIVGISDEEMIMELERQKRNIPFDEELLYDYGLENIDFEKSQIKNG